MIFQTDCYFLRLVDLSPFLQYDYVGPCHLGKFELATTTNTPKGVGINGGLCLRRKSACIKALEQVTLEQINDYRKAAGLSVFPRRIDDSFFYHAMELLGLNLTPESVCKSFAIQDVEVDDRTLVSLVGVHGFDKPQYLTPEKRVGVLLSQDFAWADGEVGSEYLRNFYRRMRQQMNLS